MFKMKAITLRRVKINQKYKTRVKHKEKLKKNKFEEIQGHGSIFSL